MFIDARPLPRALQSFKKIREGGYVYVDKTDLVWQLVNQPDQYYYLSRPRRFGKSILIDTLECYLTGQKELFEGLKIMELEKDWVKHPVIRLDLSLGGNTADELQRYLNNTFKEYEELYCIPIDETDTFANRLDKIIKRAYRQSGQRVAVLIDEYDYPLQHSWKTAEHDRCVSIYRNVFTVFKSDDYYERLVFITGITKFTQISLFSALNNLCNISFDPRFTTICGITEQEIQNNFLPELQKMAQQNDWSAQETHDRLKEYYDGYHFSTENMVDIYNPYSLINALNDKKIKNYWASSGSTTLLPTFVSDMYLRLESFDDCYLDADTMETSDVTGGGPALFLYQSGYLTIKGYEDGQYILGFPNTEVRQSLYKIVLPALAMRGNAEIVTTQNALMRHLNQGNVDEAMKCLKALIADVPYSNKKLASMDMEERYRLIISIVCHAIGFRVEVERMLSGGRIDMVVWSARYVYVIELKLQKNGGSSSAVRQIQDSGYMEPFRSGERKVIGIAIELDDLGRGLLGWQAVE